jgi:acyl carrier protein
MEVNVTRELKEEIKVLIIESLNIPDVDPRDIEDDASLFEDENLGLDSIDGLEIVMALQEKYGVRIDDQNQARFILKSINTIAEFIAKERAKK